MRANVDAITLFVAEPQRSKAFYARVFEAAVVHEDADAVALRFEHLLLNLLREPAAHELVEPAPVAPPDSGARAMLTVGVEDVDAACKALAERGVALLNGPQDRPWGVRTAAFQDPDGHAWELAR
jgi:lactoylglutathione lyase